MFMEIVYVVRRLSNELDLTINLQNHLNTTLDN